MTVTMTPTEQAAFEQYQAANNKTVTTKIIVASKGKTAKAPKNQEFVYPKGIEETDEEYLIHVPKSTPSHVSASGKSRVINVDHVLPKGTPGAVGFLGGRLFFPL